MITTMAGINVKKELRKDFPKEFSIIVRFGF
jgi:hypothetical protein